MRPQLSPAAGATLFLVGGGTVGGASAAYIVVLALELDRPREDLWWVASSFGIGLLVVAAAGEWLLRADPARLLRVAAAGNAVGVVVLAATPPYWWAVVGAGLGGLSGAIGFAAGAALLRGSASAMSAATGASSAAGLAVPLAIGGLELAGLPGGLGLLLALPAFLVLAVLPIRGEGTDTAAPLAPATQDGGPSPAGRVSVTVVVAWGAVVLAVAAEFCFLVWGVARLVDAGLAPGWAAIIGVAFPLGMVLGRAGGARWAPAPEATVRRRLRAAALLAAIATVPVVLGPGVVGVALGLFVAGVGVSVTYPLAQSLLLGLPGLLLRRGAALSVSASGLAVVVAPLALAALSARIDLRWAFVLPLPILVLLTLAALPARPSPNVPDTATATLPSSRHVPDTRAAGARSSRKARDTLTGASPASRKARDTLTGASPASRKARDTLTAGPEDPRKARDTWGVGVRR